jgi:predicted transcriptional regulator
MSLNIVFVILLFASMVKKQLIDTELLNKMIILLKQLRNEKSLSQEDVYNDTGIHVARIEAGKGNVTVSTLSKLLKYYEIPMSSFFERISE